MRLNTTIVALMLASALVPTVVLLGFGRPLWVIGPLFFALVLTIGVGSQYARSLTQPLRDCVGQALNISRGIFGNEVPVRSRNEIGDLTHTFNYMSKQLRSFDLENRGLYQSLEQGYLETIVALANSIDSKDSYTRGHSQRVSELSVAIGRELGLGERELKQLAFGGILHDIGKIGIVERILLKQSRLTDEEMSTMREHPEIGASIIEAVAFLAPALPAVRNHHERWDGSGYPDRMVGERIPLIARIVNVADTWDACTSTRPYQNALPFEDALAIIQGLSGTQCDPKVVIALEHVLAAWRLAGRQVTAADSVSTQRRMA
jgi:HD-GYP domain-containing protein (c-di-GMP phosphodiesterase class II)